MRRNPLSVSNSPLSSNPQVKVRFPFWKGKTDMCVVIGFYCILGRASASDERSLVAVVKAHCGNSIQDGPTIKYVGDREVQASMCSMPCLLCDLDSITEKFVSSHSDFCSKAKPDSCGIRKGSLVALIDDSFRTFFPTTKGYNTLYPNIRILDRC